MSGSWKSTARTYAISTREVLKNVAAYFPYSLIETLTNYAILRTSDVLLPKDLRAGISKTAYFEAVYNHLPSDKPLLFVEFGCYKGKSIRKWAQMDQHPDSRFVGFDSFVGLPQQWRHRPAGHFNRAGEIPEIDDPRVTFVKGWFNETLPDWLGDNEFSDEATTLIHIDADLYSSCSYILTSLHNVLPCYYVMFDEYGAGEARALRDYLVAYGAGFSAILGRKRRTFSRVPGQVFGKITTTP